MDENQTPRPEEGISDAEVHNLLEQKHRPVRTRPGWLRWVIGCSIGCAVLIALLVIGAAILYFNLGRAARNAEKVGVIVNAPTLVGIGGAFDLDIIISNQSREPMTLIGVALPAGYLRGFRIEGMEPPPQEPNESSAGSDARVFRYEQPLEPGASFQVRYRLLPIQEGDFSGKVGIRAKPETLKDIPLTTRVGPKGTREEY